MIKTADQLLREIGQREWKYPANRRSRLVPAGPCRNAYRGCQGTTKGKRCGHGWCENCYSRWKKHGDSWYHSLNMQLCTKRNCFMRDAPGHPRR